MLSSILKGDFLPGKKTYILLYGGAVIVTLSWALGVNLVDLANGVSPPGDGPSFETVAQTWWVALSGAALRKGIG